MEPTSRPDAPPDAVTPPGEVSVTPPGEVSVTPPGEVSARAQAVMRNLSVDAHTARVVEALRVHGVDSVILKGPALSHWYPADARRTYADGDVWIAPAHVAVASRVLSELGFEPEDPEPVAKDGWVADMREWQWHADTWLRRADGANIDLHHCLQGVGRDAGEVWDLLWPQCVAFTLAGVGAHRLPESALALYVTLHATLDGGRHPMSLSHVKVALSRLDDAAWTRAFALAQELDAVDGFAAGLRMLPPGVQLATRLGVPEPRSVTVALLATAPPPVALGIAQLANARGLTRIWVLLRKVFPSAAFIRHWWPPAARGRRMLVVGYLYRPVWLLRHARAGYRAWSAARRAARSSS